MRGTARAHSWTAYGELHTMQATLDGLITALEQQAALRLPAVSETQQ